MKKLTIFLFLFLIPLAYANLDECKGTVAQDEVPCYLLLTFNASPLICGEHEVSVYNISTFVYNQPLANYSIFKCNATFNITDLGTYVFRFSTGDTGSIIVEEGLMNFFNLMVYIVFVVIMMVFIVFMHKFRDEAGSSIVYGFIVTAIGSILGAIVLSANFTVISGIIFSIDVDYYLAAISFILAMYTAVVSWNLIKVGKPQEEEY